MKRHGRTSRRPLFTVAALAMCCLMMPAVPAAAQEGVVRLEAETGTVYGHVKVVSSGEQTWVEGFQEAGDRVELTVHADQSGMYDISVILASADDGHKENPLLLDGERVASSVVEGKDF